MSGQLQQQGGLFRTWRRRWFGLSSEALVRFEDAQVRHALWSGTARLQHAAHCPTRPSQARPKKTPQLERVAVRYLLSGSDFHIANVGNRYTIRIEFRGKQHGTRDLKIRAIDNDEYTRWWSALTRLEAQHVRQRCGQQDDAAANADGPSRARTRTHPRVAQSPVVFGVPLTELKNRDRSVLDQEHKVPALVVTCVQFLLAENRIAEEGIFRLAGNNERITALRASVDTGTDGGVCASACPEPSV